MLETKDARFTWVNLEGGNSNVLKTIFFFFSKVGFNFSNFLNF